jgi:protein-tyrosine kinase
MMMNESVLPPLDKLGWDSPTPDSNLIGGRLVELGYLHPENIALVAAAQTKWDLPFGEAAVRLGLVSREAVQEALSRQYSFPCLPLTEDAFPAELVMVMNPQHPMAESLRTLRSQLALRWLNEFGRKCLSVVSTQRGEGRSFIAANLAVAFAQMNERTLLIDMDFRNPRQHEIFRVDNRQGLSSVLIGRQSLGQIPGVRSYEALSVLPAGPTPPNPQELLGPRLIGPILKELRSRYDVVIIDTPAWSNGADAQIIGSQTGSALLVSQPGVTSQRMTHGMVKSLRDVGVSIVGAVMNQA